MGRYDAVLTLEILTKSALRTNLVTRHGPIDRLCNRECHVFFHGRVQWVQLDSNGAKRCEANCL